MATWKDIRKWRKEAKELINEQIFARAVADYDDEERAADARAARLQRVKLVQRSGTPVYRRKRDAAQALREAERFAADLRKGGIKTARVWQPPKEGMLPRVYFPGKLGFLAVSREGPQPTLRGRYTLAESALYPSWRKAVGAAREASRARRERAMARQLRKMRRRSRR